MKNLYDREIPIFFSVDDNYLPYLSVAIKSLTDNANKNYKYRIVILNTGLNAKRCKLFDIFNDDNFKIDFVNISKQMEGIESKFKNIYHFGLASYYRLFIENLFPQYDRIIYLDCDIVVLGDISKLFFIDMENKNIAGVVEQFILHSDVFSLYTKEAVGVDAKEYINSGIMLMDLNKLREQKVEQSFVNLINSYNFDVIDPDQAYINYLCKGKIKYLSFDWNRTPIECVECKNPNIVHYALGLKPWQDKNMFLGEYFWKYARLSPFYTEIEENFKSFDVTARLKKERAGIDIQLQAIEYAKSSNTFKKILK